MPICFKFLLFTIACSVLLLLGVIVLMFDAAKSLIVKTVESNLDAQISEEPYTMQSNLDQAKKSIVFWGRRADMQGVINDGRYGTAKGDLEEFASDTPGFVELLVDKAEKLEGLSYPQVTAI